MKNSMNNPLIPHHESEAGSNQDSFQDIVANLVGVILILAMFVGAKVTNDAPSVQSDPSARTADAPVEKATPTELKAQLADARQSALSAKNEAEQLATQLVRITRESAEFDAQRVELAMHRGLIEEDLARRRQKLTAQQQREFDVQRRLVECQLDLDKSTKQQLALLSAPKPVKELENVPTPLAKDVDGESIHLRLKSGLVSVVPLNELLEEVQLHIEDFRRRLQQQPEVVDTYGPIDGYRIRMTIARQASLDSIGGPIAGQMQRVSYDQFAEVLPTSESIGQDVAMALAPGGSLHDYLQSRRGKSPAVVVWLYTDSFSEFRLLKRTLWEMGFALATRPLPPGANIGASPHGTKAAAQ